MNKLPRWVVPENFPMLFDFESSTAIEMVSRLYGVMQTFIDEYNDYVEKLNNSMDAINPEVNEKFESFAVGLRQEFQDFIDIINLKTKSQDNKLNEAVEYMVTNINNSVHNVINEMKENGQLTDAIMNAFDAINQTVSELNNLYVEYTTETNEKIEALIRSTNESLESLNALIIEEAQIREDNDSNLRKKTSYYTPEMFGAVGDGITDDSDAILSMLNEIKSHLADKIFLNEAGAKDYTNVKILFSGCYAISKPIVFESSYNLVLDNLKLKALLSFSGDCMVKFSNITRNLFVTNLDLDGSLVAPTCLHIEGYSLATKFSNIFIHHFAHYGIYTKDKGHEIIVNNAKINQLEWGEWSAGKLADLSHGTGIYLASERHDNNFTNIVLNYCKDYTIENYGSCNHFVNCHFYVGAVYNDSKHGNFTECQFDGTQLITKGFFSLNGGVMTSNGGSPIIVLNDTAEWVYNYSKIIGVYFSSGTDNTPLFDLSIIGEMPMLPMHGNVFERVTSVITGLPQIISPTHGFYPETSAGNQDEGFARYGDLVFCWGKANTDKYITYPNNVTISLPFNFFFTRTEYNPTAGNPFENSVGASGFWLNGTGNTEVKWFVIGRQ